MQHDAVESATLMLKSAAIEGAHLVVPFYCILRNGGSGRTCEVSFIRRRLWGSQGRLIFVQYTP